ncbi:6-phosphofructokinase [Stratiformator vulcanicus]|uniref:6-phosphofructokinase n=1 Tax=Stratiformator vulcanicus TaxID=2527980 RepID=A0A517R0E2_9PLAN|nr:6-phosphofructokinase [Stratiformator vulcanicus]QDT37290.1 6-phosphofructokinase [Stratiformator vulcanicus]
MRRIGVLTAGGDTPALNATIYGVVERANQLGVEVIGIIKGFGGMVDPRIPHLRLNPLRTTIPELRPDIGGTILGASRTYIDKNEKELLKAVVARLRRLGIEGIICVGGDGTINGLQPISDFIPCALAPKTIDNDLGLNYIEEPNDWELIETPGHKSKYSRIYSRTELELADIVNYATPGYATAVFVVAQAIERTRTTAESHRRIAIVEVMGRDSGYIALGSAYGQPDIILVPEIPIDIERLERRVREIYELQKHVVIVVGEGVRDEEGHQLGAKSASVDPAGNIQFTGASEALQQILIERLGDGYFQHRRRHDNAKQAIFTRKVGHTQRGGRPIMFDRFYATQLGGKATELLVHGRNNHIATLQYSPEHGFKLDSIAANKLRDRWGQIHARTLHPYLYDEKKFQPSKFGRAYLKPIFTQALGRDDVEHLLNDAFNPGKLSMVYPSVNVDIHKRLEHLEADGIDPDPI